MNRITNRIKKGLLKSLLTLSALVLQITLFAQAEPTAMEQKFGVSDSTILFLLIGFAVMFTIIIITVADAINNLAKSKELWKGRNMTKLPFLIVGMLGLSFTAMAGPYAEVETSAFVLDESTFWILVVADVVLFGIAVYYIYMLKNLTAAIRGEVAAEPQYEQKGPSWAEVVLKKLTDAVPVKEEKDVLTDHDYDGIQELDNNLPPWWKWMFYLCIGWAFVYFIYYHVLDMGELQEEAYVTEMAEAKAEVAQYLEARALNVDESSVELVLDPERINAGKAIFLSLCKQCHGAAGEGGVGPNMTDDYWINGGGIKNIFTTIKYGVPAKGMISWKDQLSPVQMQNVATYITTLRGTNPPNGKAPQGELYTPAVEESAPAETESTEGDNSQPESPENSENTDQSTENMVSEVTP